MVWLFITLTIYHRWKINHLNVSNAFLHNELVEQVYMRQPPSFKNKQFSSHVWRLHKAIYKLKQSLRQWFATLSSYFQSLIFHQSSADYSLQIFLKNENIIYLLVYVDDIFIMRNIPIEVARAIHQLKQSFRWGILATFPPFSVSKPLNHLWAFFSINNRIHLSYYIVPLWIKVIPCQILVLSNLLRSWMINWLVCCSTSLLRDKISLSQSNDYANTCIIPQIFTIDS